MARMRPAAPPRVAAGQVVITYAHLCAGVRSFSCEDLHMNPEMPRQAFDTLVTSRPYPLATASAMSGVSVITRRKQLKAGACLPRSRNGAHGETWQIDLAGLTAFVGEQYGRPAVRSADRAFQVTGKRRSSRTPSSRKHRKCRRATPASRRHAPGAWQGKPSVETAESGDKRVEAIMSERIRRAGSGARRRSNEAEEVAAEPARPAPRGFFARVFRGKG